MERKKLLLVAVSVGVFLVIVIGATILVFSPSGTRDGYSEIATSGPAGTRVPAAIAPAAADSIPVVPRVTTEVAISIVPPAAPQPGVQESAPAAGGGGAENVFYFNGENITDLVTIEKLPNGVTRTTINVPRVQAAPSPAQAAAGAKPASAAGSKASDYWVQAGSFTKKSGADTVKEVLAQKGIGSVVTNSSVNGSTFYRVRIGPYTSKTEADYWLSLVRSISGMEGAQVWRSKAL